MLLWNTERILKGKGGKAKAPNKYFQRYFHDETCHQIIWWFGGEILASSQIRYSLLHEVFPSLSLWKNCLFRIPIAFNFFFLIVFLPFYLYYSYLCNFLIFCINCFLREESMPNLSLWPQHLTWRRYSIRESVQRVWEVPLSSGVRMSSHRSLSEAQAQSFLARCSVTARGSAQERIRGESGAHWPEFKSCHLEVLCLWINYPTSRFHNDLVSNMGIIGTLIWHLNMAPTL